MNKGEMRKTITAQNMLFFSICHVNVTDENGKSTQHIQAKFTERTEMNKMA